MKFQTVRGATRKLLRKIGYGVYKIDSSEFYNFENLLYAVLNNDKYVKYVQIGANDGIRVDPMFDFVRKNHKFITGLLLEPVKKYFEQLKFNYLRFTKITPIQIAIHNSKKSMVIYTAGSHSGTLNSEQVFGMSSFDKNHLLKSGYVLESNIIEEEVPCCTLSELLNEYNFVDINVLILDTEGYDFEILRELDLSQINPKIVLFEHGFKESTMTLQNFETLLSKFNLFGYQTTIVNNDAIAVKTNFLLDNFRV